MFHDGHELELNNVEFDSVKLKAGQVKLFGQDEFHQEMFHEGHELELKDVQFDEVEFDDGSVLDETAAVEVDETVDVDTTEVVEAFNDSVKL